MATKKPSSTTKRAQDTPKRKSPSRPTLMQEVGKRIRAVRKMRGLGQDTLAYSIDLDRAHIGMIENGKRAPTVPTLARIAVGLECDVGDFFPPLSDLYNLLPED
ncbi:helix-turn-helix transcriptional regulator [Luteimonas panaciterrae]|uniref:helix-turn-helix domain-containing protein n=1 Tax=Luteimonas panaciterrae TaxID=363885 RepID=UPI00299E50C2|nr:helix-turn-helix transcriptional regulator [Luteimonas panaciterrae]